MSLYNFGQTLRWFDSPKFLEWLIIWNWGSNEFHVSERLARNNKTCMHTDWILHLKMSLKEKKRFSARDELCRLTTPGLLGASWTQSRASTERAKGEHGNEGWAGRGRHRACVRAWGSGCWMPGSVPVDASVVAHAHLWTGHWGASSSPSFRDFTWDYYLLHYYSITVAKQGKLPWFK